MKILVTGAAGYVGTKLALELLEQGHQIVAVDTFWFGDFLPASHPNLHKSKVDIRDFDPALMQGVDAVVHLANIANDPTGDLNPKLTWEVNVLASKFLIEAAIEARVLQFVFASSGSVYGVKEEEQVTEDLSLVPISDYNKTKMISERVFLSYKDYIKLSIIRPATVCGLSPRMRLDLTVNMLTVQALENNCITVFGGKQIRPNIHIDDMVQVYLHTLQKPDALSGIFNAGFENLSVLEIANRIQAHTGAELSIKEVFDERSYRLNSDKLTKTGFQPRKNINDAIQEVKAAYTEGSLKVEDTCYNLRVMQHLGL